MLCDRTINSRVKGKVYKKLVKPVVIDRHLFIIDYILRAVASVDDVLPFSARRLEGVATSLVHQESFDRGHQVTLGTGSDITLGTGSDITLGTGSDITLGTGSDIRWGSLWVWIVFRWAVFMAGQSVSSVHGCNCLAMV